MTSYRTRTNETEGVYLKWPCGIFDEFTTDPKLGGFPFKVKSVRHENLTGMRISENSLGGKLQFVRHETAVYSRTNCPKLGYSPSFVADRLREVSSIHHAFDDTVGVDDA